MRCHGNCVLIHGKSAIFLCGEDIADGISGIWAENINERPVYALSFGFSLLTGNPCEDFAGYRIIVALGISVKAVHVATSASVISM
jgi:hypothetical protein